MPFYEYQCKNCGHDLEAMQKINDPPLKKCPHCGKSQLQRLMSAPVFRLKGAGWYETDFKGDQDNKKNLADRPESDASKETVKDVAKDSGSKDKDAKPDSKDAAKPADKAEKSEKADKTADKPAAKETEKKAAPKPSQRGASSTSSKGNAKKPAPKKPAAKAKRRR
jgi:putative FmdB family regulatory protein